MQSILAGLENAVEFARRNKLAYPGKGGRQDRAVHAAPAGDFIALVCRVSPSRAPETVVVVMLSGHSRWLGCRAGASQISKRIARGGVKALSGPAVG